MIDKETSDILTNKMLKQFGTTIDKIMATFAGGIIPTGGIKNKKPVTDYWWNVYGWQKKEEYEAWREWALEQIEGVYSKEDLDFWEMIWDIKHEYLPFYKKEGQLF